MRDSSTDSRTGLSDAHDNQFAPIAELLVARGWAVERAGSLGLDATDTFWRSISHIVRELAGAGYFLTQEWVVRYLAEEHVGGDPATWFESRAYQIRSSGLADIDALASLEQTCWIEPLRATREELQHRIRNYPEGRFVAEVDGEIVGAIFSQRIEDTTALYRTNFRDVLALDRADAPIVQALAVNVLPSFQQHGLGYQLLEFLLQWQRFSRTLNGRLASLYASAALTRAGFRWRSISTSAIRTAC